MGKYRRPESYRDYTHYKVVKKFYRKIKRRSGKPVARAVVAKELAKGVWYMLTKDEHYKGFKGQSVKAASQTFPTAVGGLDAGRPAEALAQV